MQARAIKQRIYMIYTISRAENKINAKMQINKCFCGYAEYMKNKGYFVAFRGTPAGEN